MSATITSNSSTMKWEQVVSKKRSNARPTAIPKLQAKEKSKDVKVMPIIETLPPLKVEKSIYDLLDREDDSDEETRKKVEKMVKPKPVSNPVAKKSPKPLKQSQSIRLTASSSVAQPAKKLDIGYLETVMSTLTLEDFNQEYLNFLTLYPTAQGISLRHMSTFLNLKFNTVADIEPSFNNDVEIAYPLSKLEKKLEDFYDALIRKSNKSECESAFEYIIEEILTDSKSHSTYGYRMVGQMLIRKYPDLMLKNLSKFDEQITANRHKNLRCLIALWTIGQGGFLNLQYGLKIWFELMVNHINTKQATTSFVVSYLSYILDYHRKKAISNKENEYLSIKNFFKFCDLLDDKTVTSLLSKESNAKLQNCYSNLRDLLNKQSKSSYSDYFEQILTNLMSDESSASKKKEVLDCAKLCLLHGKDTYTKWREIYLKYLKSTNLLLKEISTSWSDYQNTTTSSDLKQTLIYFEQNSLFYIVNSLQTSKQQKNLIKNSKIPKQQQLNTNELQQMQNINTLVKGLVQLHFSRGVGYSIMTRLFRIFVLVTLTISLFFYWDINSNKSNYTNKCKIQLEKFGLLDTTLHTIDYANDSFMHAKKVANENVPPMYQKFRKTIVYYSSNSWNLVKDYSLYAWKASEIYRNSVYNYSIEAKTYIQRHLPTLTDNLTSLFYLFLNYLSTIYAFIMFYFNQLISFIEINLMGWKQGELAIVFTDAFKHLFSLLSNFF